MDSLFHNIGVANWMRAELQTAYIQVVTKTLLEKIVAQFKRALPLAEAYESNPHKHTLFLEPSC
jgi:hypothetical protein